MRYLTWIDGVEAAVELGYYEVPRQATYEEIAEVLELPVGTIKSRVVRAERALRPYLEKYREYL